MRIGLNLLHAQPEIGGGWQYIGNMVAALGKYDSANVYVAFVTDVSAGLVPRKPNFLSVRIPIRAASRFQRVFYENTVLNILVKKYRLDCLHWFANTRSLVNLIPSIVTIYDLLVFHDTTSFSRIQRFYLRAMIPFTARRASALLPMSEATAADLQRILGVDASRMVVIPTVLNERFAPADPGAAENFRSRYGLPAEFWLYVAHFYPHKNHERLLSAYAQLKRHAGRAWPLVLRGSTGAIDEVRKHIEKQELKDDVVFLPELAEAEMPLLYSAASALVYPSLFEGGAMPVAEAMACGCPVAGSDIPVVKEFAGDAVAFFDPRDIEAISETMRACQGDAARREDMRRRGLRQIEDLKPGIMVDKLRHVYSRAMRGKPSAPETSPPEMRR